MIKKLAHIGIAVKDVEEVAKLYSEALGLQCEDITSVEDQRVKIAFLPVGETHIELLEGTTPESPIAKHIERRGEGIHHIALEVDNIEAALQQAKEQGVTLIDEEPRIGAHRTKIAFIHPKSTRGVLFEFMETTD
ncbi:MAG: methylmalonyl-CoA epimerase [Candidatus Heimdallarchaeota archaeon]